MAFSTETIPEVTTSNATSSTDRDRLTPSLKQRPRWVCWRYEQNGDKKPPIDPNTGKKESATDPETWGTYEEAMAHHEDEDTDTDGIGYVLGPDDTVAGIDLDDVVLPDGKIRPWALNLTDRLNSYTEFSPSGTGLHILVDGEKLGDRCEADHEDGGSIEMYDDGRYFTFTGDHFEGTSTTVEPREDEYNAIQAEFVSQDGEGSHSLEAIEDADMDLCDPTKTRVGDGEYAIECDHGAEWMADLVNQYEDDDKTTRWGAKIVQDGVAGRYLCRRQTDRGYVRDPENGFEAEDGSADRSQAEFALCGMLAGIVDHYSDRDPEECATDIRAYVSMCVSRDSWTEDGQLRKWLFRTDGYRTNTTLNAIEEYDPRRWRAIRGKRGPRSDQYGDMTIGTVIHVIMPLPDEDTDDYLTRQEVVDRSIAKEKAEGTDPRSRKTYTNTLGELQRDGRVRMACLGGNKYAYYPEGCPDPPEAKWVKCEGTKRPPGHDPAKFSEEKWVDREV